jgi:hypothetical protein
LPRILADQLSEAFPFKHIVRPFVFFFELHHPIRTAINRAPCQKPGTAAVFPAPQFRRDPCVTV